MRGPFWLSLTLFFDETYDGLDDLVLGHLGGIDDLGVGGNGQGADCSGAIALIAVFDFFEDFIVIDDFASAAKLGDTAAGALGGGGV